MEKITGVKPDFLLNYITGLSQNEGTENSIPPLFFVWLRLNATAPKFLARTDRGRTDFERKSLADEREAYKGTLSEETRIKQKI